MLAKPHVGGWGGSALVDGESALIATTDGDTYNFPAEVIESAFPLLIERYALNVEAGGGAGRHRGGFGVVREFRVHGPSGATSSPPSAAPSRVPGAWRRSPGTTASTSSHAPISSIRRGRVPTFRRRPAIWSAPSPATAAGSATRSNETPRGCARTCWTATSPSRRGRASYGFALDPDSLRPDAAETAGFGASMTLRVATDIGGTFTDLVAVDARAARPHRESVDDAA